MEKIIIDEEFRDLLPALDEEIYKALEENLLQNGCRDAVVLWDGILIDGHNLYEDFRLHRQWMKAARIQPFIFFSFTKCFTNGVRHCKTKATALAGIKGRVSVWRYNPVN